MSVLYDGGIRSGYDIMKVLALGADAAMVGRAYIYALAVGGEDGVKHMVQTMLRELDSAMAGCGCRTVKELNPSFIRKT